VSVQEVMQLYMFERILKRISLSNYRDNFILKGGLLLSSISGIHSRTTMDMDTMIKGLKLEEDSLKCVIEEILSKDEVDGITFEIIEIEDIRNEDKYGGFRFKIYGKLESIKNFLTIDVSTGDIITPKEIDFQFETIFNDGYINVKAYNYETILAEKFQSILENNGSKGRMKDYYDIWFFINHRYEIVNSHVLKEAIINTFTHRKSFNDLENVINILYIISKSIVLRKRWIEYASKHKYTLDIEFERIMEALIQFNKLIDNIKLHNNQHFE